MALKETALSILIKAKDLASDTLAKFRGGVDASEKSASNAAASVDKYGNALTDSDKAAGRFLDKSGRMREANGRFVEGLKRTNQTLEHTERGVAGLTTKIIALASTYLSITALKNALGAIIGTGAQFEQLKTQITTLMGSLEEGERAVEWIKGFAKTTPASLEGVTQGFIKLKAFGIDPMNGSYQAIVDQTSKLGFSQDKMEGIILAVGQAWTKQKLQGEEALQLIERGVPVWDLLAKATGRTAVQLQEMASKGQLGRKEIRLLIDEMGRASAGAAEQQMNTWDGMISNLKDSWTSFLNDIAEAGVFDYAKAQLRELLDLATQMAKDGRLQAYAKQISDYLVSMATSAKEFITTAIARVEELSRTTDLVVGTVQLAFNSFSAGVSTVVAAVTWGFGQIASGWASVTGALGLETLSGKFQGLSDALMDVSRNATAQLEQDAKDIQAALNKINEATLGKAEAELEGLADTADTTANRVEDSAERINTALEPNKDTAAAIADLEKKLQAKRMAMQAAEQGSQQYRLAQLEVIAAEKELAKVHKTGADATTAYAKTYDQLTKSELPKALRTTDKALRDLEQQWKGNRIEAGEYARQKKELLDQQADIKRALGTETQAVNDNAQALDKAAKSQQAYNSAKREDTDALTKNTQAEEENQNRRKHGLALAGKSAAAWHAASDAMGQAYRALGQYMIDAVQGAKGTVTYLKLIGDASRIVRREAEITQQRFADQQRAADSYLQQLLNTQTATAALAQQAEQAMRSYSLLGDEQLGPLRNAIAAIRAETTQLNDDLAGSVSQLQDELDRLNNNTGAIERRAFEKRLAGLKEQEAQARKLADEAAVQQAKQAQALLAQTYQLKQKASQAAPAAPVTPTPERTVRVEFNDAQGRFAGQFAPQDADRLLAQLERLAEVSA